MRPVNLLPDEHRPRRASGARKGSAYVVVGVLGFLVVTLTLYVMTANKVSSSKEKTAQAQSELDDARRKMQSLQSFGSFASIKTVRTASVRDLAQVRFDWERLMRELALVLPDGMWLSEADASTKPSDTAGPAAAAAPTGPTAMLTGCARRQPDVARFMVRLRKLHGVDDVELQESSQADAGAGAAAPSSTGPAGADCGDLYKFTINLTFDPSVSTSGRAAPRKVPASLGGGG